MAFLVHARYTCPQPSDVCVRDEALRLVGKRVESLRGKVSCVEATCGQLDIDNFCAVPFTSCTLYTNTSKGRCDLHGVYRPKEDCKRIAYSVNLIGENHLYCEEPMLLVVGNVCHCAAYVAMGLVHTECVKQDRSSCRAQTDTACASGRGVCSPTGRCVIKRDDEPTCCEGFPSGYCATSNCTLDRVCGSSVCCGNECDNSYQVNTDAHSSSKSLFHQRLLRR